MKSNQTMMLIILDGWGYRSESSCNAIAQAKTPYLDHLFKTYPHTLLKCSGKAVGLPDGVMGNSEVGHLNIGAGRVVLQDMLRIDAAIEDSTLQNNPAFTDLISKIKQTNGRIHLMGLLSDGAVHSHINHLFALILMTKSMGIPVRIHAIMDGITLSDDFIKPMDFTQLATGFLGFLSVLVQFGKISNCFYNTFYKAIFVSNQSCIF